MTAYVVIDDHRYTCRNARCLERPCFKPVSEYTGDLREVRRCWGYDTVRRTCKPFGTSTRRLARQRRSIGWTTTNARRH